MTTEPDASETRNDWTLADVERERQEIKLQTDEQEFEGVLK